VASMGDRRCYVCHIDTYYEQQDGIFQQSLRQAREEIDKIVSEQDVVGAQLKTERHLAELGHNLGTIAKKG